MFPKLPANVVNDLSTDQYYAYRICWAIINGVVEDDRRYLEVGPIVLSRWLTLGCRILRYNVSLDEPSQILKVLVHFCLTVYFPTWFDIKLEHQTTNGYKYQFSLIKKINSLSNEEIREVALDAMQRNGYFAHPENLLIAMLGDNDEQIRSMAVTNVIARVWQLKRVLLANVKVVPCSNHKYESRCVL